MQRLKFLGQCLKCIAGLVVAIAFFYSTIGVAPAVAIPFKSDRTEVQLVSEMSHIQPGQPFSVGLHFKPSPGWHTYWRNPGDSGAPTRVNWTLPAGFIATELIYPYPERLPIGPLVNFGYKGESLLLTEITPPSDLTPGQSVLLTAKVSWLVCEVECVPEDATFRLELPVTAAPPTPDSTWKTRFEQTRRALPQPSPWQASFRSEPETWLLRVNAPELQQGEVQQVSFFPDQDGVIRNAAEQAVTVDDQGLLLQLVKGSQTQLETLSGVLVIRSGLGGAVDSQAVAIAATPETTGSQAIQPRSSVPVGRALGLALLGGLILNLMPCVFPILCLKALGVAQKAQQSPKQARLHGLTFMLGVLASFLVLVSVLLVLRGLGQQIGWGFQLQSPLFVLILIYVLFAVGLNLSGVYVVGASVMGLGQGLANRAGYAGEFFTGMLATVMATPCAAPFMATAITVALTQPPIVAIAIFLSLGLGLGLPYLLISCLPGLRRYLPKPGAWMETFQQFLAFPIYGATAWLVWVLALQTGTDGLAIALTGLLLIALAAWFYQKTQNSRQPWRRVSLIGALGAFILALTLAPVVERMAAIAPQTTQSDAATITWKPYQPEQLAALRESGQPVFVNFSAAWCVSCLVNERVALSQPEVLAAFKQKRVALVKADWTNRDATITEALSKFGRSGVPLYVLYPQGLDRGEPMILPHVLSPATIRDALTQVSPAAEWPLDVDVHS